MKIDLSDLHGTDVMLQAAAAQRLKNRLAENPGDTQAKFKLAEVQRQLGDLDSARTIYEDLLTSEEFDEAIRHHLERGVAILGQHDVVPPCTGERLTPYVMIADFLDDAERRELDELVAGARQHFEAATIESGVNQDWRMAVVADHDLGDFESRFVDRVHQHVKRTVSRIEIAPFDIESTELQLSAHHDGGFYKVHRDRSSTGPNSTRHVTFVYYFCASPKGFTGGDLLLYDSEPELAIASGRRYTRIEPTNNTLILFPSDAFHQVTRIHTVNSDYLSGRFTLNGWLH